MAAFCLFKLLCKTFSYSVNPVKLAPTVRLISVDKNGETGQRKISYDRQKRNLSLPSRHSTKISKLHPKNGKEQCVRNISISLENMKALRYFEEKDKGDFSPAFRYVKQQDANEEEESENAASHTSPDLVETEVNPPKPEITFTESAVRYELSSIKANHKNYANVVGYLYDYELEKPYKVFPHLQPNNMKPYGSSDSVFCPLIQRRRNPIVYPESSNAESGGEQSVVTTSNLASSIEHADGDKPLHDDGGSRKFSTYLKEKEYPGYEEPKRIMVCASNSKNLSRKNYSTCTLRAPRLKGSTHISRLPIGLAGNFEQESTRKAKLTVLKLKDEAPVKNPVEYLLDNVALKMEEKLFRDSLKVRVPQTVTEAIFENMKRENHYADCAKNIEAEAQANTEHNAELDAAKVAESKTGEEKRKARLAFNGNMLGRLSHSMDRKHSRQNSRTFASNATKDEECYEQIKLCRTIKVKKLPRFVPMDCPCPPEEPLAPGKPLPPLKKRFEPKAPEWDCPPPQCPSRLDDNYKIVKKKLRQIKPGDCPCIEKEYTDFKIRRLPKRVVPEPPRPCPCEHVCCDPVRADDGMTVDSKKLPKLIPGHCPCIQMEMKDTPPLARLVPRPVKEPEKICPCVADECCKFTPRADAGLTVEKKKLPVLKPPDCPCPEPIEFKEEGPLKPLKARKVCPPPRVCKPDFCDDSVRADADCWVYWSKVDECEEVKPTTVCDEWEKSPQSQPLRADGGDKKRFSTMSQHDSKSISQRGFHSTPFFNYDFGPIKSQPMDNVRISYSNNAATVLVNPVLQKKLDHSSFNFFNVIYRFISTCRVFATQTNHQPNRKFFKPKEAFIVPWPGDTQVETVRERSRRMLANQDQENEDCCNNRVNVVREDEELKCKEDLSNKTIGQRMSFPGGITQDASERRSGKGGHEGGSLYLRSKGVRKGWERIAEGDDCAMRERRGDHKEVEVGSLRMLTF